MNFSIAIDNNATTIIITLICCWLIYKIFD